MTLLALKTEEGAVSQGMWWPSADENKPRFTAGKQRGTSVLQPQGTKFCCKNKQGQGCPQSLQKGTHLDLSPVRPIPDLRPTELSADTFVLSR